MPAVLPVTAKHGKRLRAEPIAQLYEQGRVHHVGQWPTLEQQMVTWVAGMDSPDRMDAAVHGLTELAAPLRNVATGTPMATWISASPAAADPLSHIQITVR
ncbi:hypothetical protein ACFQL8_09355 [Streptomyces goshikiensis]|uniref:hypothetical protein n=1 Tax=Streptomyces goshikiensis TaxID=1942 RepID=UPI003327CD03